MKNKFLALIASSMLILSFSSLKADMSVGLSFMAGQADTSGHELENGAAADKNSTSVKEYFYGASVFVEAVGDNGFALGLDYVPVDMDIGDGKRTDTSTGADATSEADTGTRSASASLEDLITIYANIPLGDQGVYALAGYHMVTVTTSEGLPNSSYGNDDITGYQIGIGRRADNYKLEFFYSDFDDVSLTATGGKGSHKIEADADAMGFKASVLF